MRATTRAVAGACAQLRGCAALTMLRIRAYPDVGGYSLSPASELSQRHARACHLLLLLSPPHRELNSPAAVCKGQPTSARISLRVACMLRLSALSCVQRRLSALHRCRQQGIRECLLLGALADDGVSTQHV